MTVLYVVHNDIKAYHATLLRRAVGYTNMSVCKSGDVEGGTRIS